MICRNLKETFVQESKFLPDSIVVFRDGVGDHQMDIVKDTEIALMKRAFSDISPEYSPHFCVVVVQKRISARIFAVDRSGNIGNAPPGTVIDHTITKRGTRDFYLVSQHVRQGTVTPTRYVVLENTPGGAKEQVSLDIDTIQRLQTFCFCTLAGSYLAHAFIVIIIIIIIIIIITLAISKGIAIGY